MAKSGKILVSIASLGCGGAERVLSILSASLADNFQDVTVVLWKSIDMFYTLDDRIKIISLETLAGTDGEFKKIKAFRTLVRSYRPNCILSFLYPYSIRILISLIGIGIPVIVAERRDPRRVKGGIVMRFLRDCLYLRANSVLVQSKFNKALYPKFLRNKIEVIYNPIKLNKQLLSLKRPIVTKKEIVTVGRLIPEKNHKLLIDAFYIFNNKHSGWSLKIWGEGPLKSELLDYAKEKGLIPGHNFYLMGTSRTVLEDILPSSIFVLSSKSEGMPNALFEALCLGIPSVSTKVSGIYDLLENEENILLANDNSEDMYQAMERLIFDEGLAAKVSENSRKLYRILYLDDIVNQWIHVLKRSYKKS